jgi:hypothetical protein
VLLQRENPPFTSGSVTATRPKALHEVRASCVASRFAGQPLRWAGRRAHSNRRQSLRAARGAWPPPHAGAPRTIPHRTRRQCHGCRRIPTRGPHRPRHMDTQNQDKVKPLSLQHSQSIVAVLNPPSLVTSNVARTTVAVPAEHCVLHYQGGVTEYDHEKSSRRNWTSGATSAAGVRSKDAAAGQPHGRPAFPEAPVLERMRPCRSRRGFAESADAGRADSGGTRDGARVAQWAAIESIAREDRL